MAEATLFEPEEEGAAAVEANLTAANKTKGAEQRGDDSDSVTQPLLQHQDSRDEGRRADVQTATDGADRATSVPQELEVAGRDQAGCSGSVRSLCSDNSRHECPICSELFDSHGDHRLTLLNCDHALCHQCTTSIMSRAKDASRLRCPFCRQNTPFPQWEIRRLQEESYSDGVYQPAEDLVVGPGPELPAVPVSPLCCLTLERQLEAQTDRNICGCCMYPSCLVRGLRVVRLHSLCFSLSLILLLFLVLLSYFLYMIVPMIMLSIFFNKG
ncbi:uncharacterized protein LOC129350996 [Amphiprion ocellaris]|uniref:uncharacterized protein LOC129350996 n=1 Tax=Amphiprion ocellaris TaxID=80972 RepID=UPI002410BB58|nr:uncharacterized protein LOC129350996 [Amphiprion ocellaris]